MLQNLAQKLWGNFKDKEERAKFFRLASIFAFTIGVYWLLNPLKDVIFLKTVGKQFLPTAKIISLIALFPLLIIYGKLVDAFPRHRLFYAICAVYSLTAFLFAYFLQDPIVGLSNCELSPFRLIGWLWFAFVESFGSLIVALFWSFASDISTPDSAKRGFSVIALGAQFGGVVGPLLVYPVTGIIDTSLIVVIGGIGILCIAFQMAYFMWVTPDKELIGYHSDEQTAAYRKPAPGFLEGVKLIISQPYLNGIVLIVSLYEILATMIEFHMKIFAAQVFTDIGEMTAFFFKYAMLVNGVALTSLLLGIGAVGRALGLSRTLLLLPFLIGVGITLIWMVPSLWVSLVVLAVVKGLNYALNQPAKEQLYIPTSRDSKYKAKAWIDSFGSRVSKSVGSSVHMLRPVLQSFFIMTSSLIGFGLIAVWIVAALFVSRIHAQALKEDRQVC